MCRSDECSLLLCQAFDAAAGAYPPLLATAARAHHGAARARARRRAGDEEAWDSGRCPAAALLEGLRLEERMLSTPPRTGQAPVPAPHAAHALGGVAGVPLVFDEPSPAAPAAPDTPAPTAPSGAPVLGHGQLAAAAGAAGLAAAEGEGTGAAAAAAGPPATGGDGEVHWLGEEHAAADAAAPTSPLAPFAQAADMAGEARNEADRGADAGGRWMPKPATPLANMGHAAPGPAPVRAARPRLRLRRIC